jgi:NTP pyrophosphatase (non-canonical NTP hydrolase)|nr:MAG TPA: NTP-PPase-like protein [Caudoviricetes sp.]
MENINLNKWRDRAYKTACEHGLHDKELSNEHCLMLVITELSEAVEADRKGRLGNRCKSRFEMEYNRYPALVEEEKRFKCSFENNVKDSLPDELADAAIRLLDLCGLRNIELENDCLDDEVLEEYSRIFINKTFTESIFNITKNLIDRDISYSLIKIFGLAKHLDIDLLWHIEQKQRYNELRPMLNGKRY